MEARQFDSIDTSDTYALPMDEKTQHRKSHNQAEGRPITHTPASAQKQDGHTTLAVCA